MDPHSHPHAHPPPRVGPALAHLPNTLSASRVLIAIAMVALLSNSDYSNADFALRSSGDNRTIVALGLAMFVLRAITDALAGFLARRWRVVSVLGRIIDPFADKVLVLGAFVVLAGPQFSAGVYSPPPTDIGISPKLIGTIQVTAVAPWMVVVILARDLLITTLRGLVEGRGMSFAALPAGKIKMIVQSLSIPAILLTLTLADDPTQGVARWIILTSAWGVALLTAVSALPYSLDAYRKLTS